jgi:subtilase family serine protease
LSPSARPTPWRMAALVLASALAAACAAPAADHTMSRTALPSPRLGLDTGPSTPADPDHVLPLRVYLKGRHADDRVTTALAVATPGSTEYAQYLTPLQYEARFGPTAEQTDTVSTWLTSEGMRVTGTNQHFIEVRATVEQADRAFDTNIRAYAFGLGPAADASIPAGLSADIATVTGLDADVAPTQTDQDTFRATSDHAIATTQTVTCSQYWDEYTAPIPETRGHRTAPTAPCGYTPTQLREAYSVGRYTGKGATIAVILNGHSRTMLADANRFFAGQGVAGFTPGQYTEVLDPTIDSTCDFADPLEEAVDVESAHITAPDAKIVYVGTNCGGDQRQAFLDAQTKVVDSHLADVATNAFDIDEAAFSQAVATAWTLTFQQGAIEGIGFDFAAGDFGDVAGDDGPHHVLFPGSDPWATSVGGTSLEIGRDGSSVAEYGWGDNGIPVDGSLPGTFVAGTTGGQSTVLAFPEPDYQRGVVPKPVATAGDTTPPRRVVPDVSADAGVPWRIGFTGTGTYSEVARGNGTSGATPLIAGLEADAKQATGHAVGFANPALYKAKVALKDVQSASTTSPPMMIGSSTLGDGQYVTTLGQDNTLKTTPGYDEVTGNGSPGPSFVTSFNPSS